MLHNPKVSILIPTYNQEKYIQECVESVFKQDYPEIEVIVSDDCSTDNTCKKLDLFKDNKRFKYFKNKINIGRVANYRKLLNEYASGEWIIMLDGDDFLTNNQFISYCVEKVKKDTDIIFVQGGSNKFYESNGRKIAKTPNLGGKQELLIDKNQYLFSFYDINYFSHASSFYNRKLAIKVQFYKYDILSADIESFIRLSFHGKCLLTQQKFTIWRGHDHNASKSDNLEQQLINLEWIKRTSNYALKLLGEKYKRHISKNYDKLWKKKISFVFYNYMTNYKGKNKIQKMFKVIKIYKSRYKKIFLHPLFYALVILVILDIKKVD